MPIYSSDSDDQPEPSTRLFGRQRPLHSILGGGKVADILLWRNRNLAAAILIGFTAVWFLFEVFEYNFVTLLCHISMVAMIIIFVWYNGAGLIDWNPPNIHEFKLSESAFRSFFAKINWFLLRVYEISCGKDIALFIVAIGTLWILSVIGNYVSSLNLLYLGYLSLQILPVLYERYESEVDYLAGKGSRDMKKLYKKFDSKVLNKIPRGPVKQKKLK